MLIAHCSLFIAHCPRCGTTNPEPEDVIFLGKYTLGKYSCVYCNTGFFHTLPSGHAGRFPVSFSADKKYIVYDQKAALWWALPLLDTFFNKKKRHAAIRKIQVQSHDEIVLLICLDNCYGHSLTNLLNAQLLLEKGGAGVVVIIQKSFLWLVPEGVAEVWLVDVETKNLNLWIENLDAFIKEESKRFRKIFLYDTYMPPELDQVDYEKFTRTKKFDLKTFHQTTPVITFICRDDRTWNPSPIENFLYLFCVKFRLLPYVKKFFAIRQNKLFDKVARLIKKEVKDIQFYAAGFGSSKGLSPLIENLLITGAPTEETERKWCQLYAKSHLVIGVHGSNMMLPTSLAAGFINILPRYKIDHYGEDIAYNQSIVTLSRHLDQYASPESVARHAISMLRK